MSNGMKAVLVIIVAVAITIFFGAVLAVASEGIPEIHEDKTKEKTSMRKIEKVITAIVIAFAVMAAMMVTAGAEERYIEKQFDFGRYAPVVAIHHPVYNWVLESRPDGSLSWAKPAAGKASQTFVILPTSYTGCYAIREFNNGSYTQRYLTYTQSGFRMEAPGTDKYGMEMVKDTQAYKFIWKSSDKCGGKSFRNVWRLSCKKNGICASVSGWGSFRLKHTN